MPWKRLERSSHEEWIHSHIPDEKTAETEKTEDHWLYPEGGRSDSGGVFDRKIHMFQLYDPGRFYDADH